MHTGVVSVVVPVYKVEAYLDRCINSIVKQTYTNLEIILVDDGSPDNCPQMCDEWAKRDDRIKVVHQQNAGIGMARNTGIDHALGEYICFFDSDDYIELDTIERAYTVAAQNDADMVCFGISFINSMGERTTRRVPKVSKEVFRGEEIRKDFLPKLIGPDPKTGEVYGFSMSACCKMFSMQTIEKNNWRFVSERDILSEDFYSIMQLCANVETVCVVPVVGYNYCQNNASVTRSYRRDRFDRSCHFYTEIKKLCDGLGYPTEASDRFGGVFLSFVITAMKQEVASNNSASAKRKALRSMLHNETLRSVLEARKNDKIAIKKKILFWAMRCRWVDLCYILALAQNATT